MNSLHDFIIRKEIKRVVKQGDHYRKLLNHFKIIAEEFGKEFTEDNKPTRDYFLQECLACAINADADSSLEFVDEAAVSHIKTGKCYSEKEGE